MYGVTSAGYSSTAMSWQYVLDASAVFIPVLYFNFLSIFLKRNYRIFVGISLSLAAVIAAISLTSAFKVGMVMRYGYFWVKPGPVYVILPIFYVLYTIFSLILLIRVYLQSRSDFKIRKQTIILFIGFLLGSAGGITNFFPQLFNIYPFGSFLVIVYFLFMGYAIVRYELLNIKSISVQLFSAAVAILALFNLLHSNALQDWLINFIIFLLVVFFAYLLVRGVQQEIKQRERIEQLATELEKSNDSLETANARLKELDQLKSEFVSLATHQIRSPLTAIKGYISLVQEGDYGPVSDDVKSALNIVMQSTENLVNIVGDFLNISRIDQGRMVYDFSSFDVSKIVQDVGNELKPNIDRAKLTFSVEVAPGNYMVSADVGKMKQIIGNLIDNAIKYTKKGWLKIKMTNTNGSGKILIAISDSGVGISSETLPKLFQKFSRATDANETNVIGTGLGLYVVKMMVEAQHGRVWAESPGAGKGSTFIVELPVVHVS